MAPSPRPPLAVLPPERALRGRLAPLPDDAISGARPRGAAVSVILRPSLDDIELLLIERNARPGDPWSGHLAFPGGLASGHDLSFAHTAARETSEEVGLDLRPERALGALRPVWTGKPGNLRPMPVHPVVFAAPDPAALVVDEREVRQAFWVSLGGLQSAPRQRMWRRVLGVPFRFPWVWVRGLPLWGLTLTMVEDLLRRWPHR